MVDRILSERGIDLDEATGADRAEALQIAKAECEAARERVVAWGGLHVIGTERHDSRRIDNQLRGRCGRQGDPGSTRFYLSMEDDLIRRFGGDRVLGLMDRLGMDDSMPMENRMISTMIEQAQQKVEAYYFDIRKHLVEYDDVIATQRETIYIDRNAILDGEDVHERVRALMSQEIASVAGGYCAAQSSEQWEFEKVEALFDRWHMPLPDDFFPDNVATLKRETFLAQCVEWGLEQREVRLQRVRDQLIAIGSTPEFAAAQIANVERNILLQVVDRLWMEHIDAIDELRSGIGLRSIAQTDPLVEFKREGFKSFNILTEQIRHFVTETLVNLELSVAVAQPSPPPQALSPQQMRTNADEIAGVIGETQTDSPPKASRPATAPKKPLTQTKEIKKKSGQTRPLANGASATAANGAGNGHSRTPSVPLPASRTPSQPLAAAGTKRATLDPRIFANANPNDPCPCGSKQLYKRCHGAGKR